MKPGDNEHLGDGAYLHFDGDGFELRANHHEHLSDRVYICRQAVHTLIRLIEATNGILSVVRIYENLILAYKNENDDNVQENNFGKVRDED